MDSVLIVISVDRSFYAVSRKYIHKLVTKTGPFPSIGVRVCTNDNSPCLYCINHSWRRGITNNKAEILSMIPSTTEYKLKELPAKYLKAK